MSDAFTPSTLARLTRSCSSTASVKAEALPAIPAMVKLVETTIEYSAPGMRGGGGKGGGDGGGGDGGGGEGASSICEATLTLPIDVMLTSRSVDSWVVLTTSRWWRRWWRRRSIDSWVALPPSTDAAVWEAPSDGITMVAWTMPSALM
jgi:hypothetical protein